MAEPNYRTIANEVVELGESLFELALQGQAVQHADTTIAGDVEQQAVASEQGLEQEPGYPTEEIRIAADEFFTALRLLLGVPQQNNR
ncbi:hypothetical protein [Dictyobacter arantiisoli]|uniref:Uncharacterized protein n=1 Tax=Dictyobacter arantiisoli TaxID=2014874 RepID=A0A5A5TF26_9CHLR|nr:hypothetical protein [Dictyobacter arantiisoli]GCF09609.1 hypothetical protein KDI_31730 [Dictyobacter arantiisoli]